MGGASTLSADARNARPHETAHAAPEDVKKQPATEFRVLQDNADRFQHNKDLTERRIKAIEDAGAFRAPTNAARRFNPQYGDVQQLAAVDSMTVRGAEGRETLLKLALPGPTNQAANPSTDRPTDRPQPISPTCQPTNQPASQPVRPTCGARALKPTPRKQATCRLPKLEPPSKT